MKMKDLHEEKLAQAQSWRQELESNNGLPESFEYEGKTLDTKKALAAICEILDGRAKAPQSGGAK